MLKLSQGRLLWGVTASVIVGAISLMPYPRTLASEIQDEAPPPRWLVDKHFLNCTPSTLTPNGTLTLKLLPNHPGELGIRREKDGTWYFLISTSPSPGQQLLMLPGEFSKQTKLVVRADIKGYVPVVNGSNQPVFTTSGKYDIYVSESLESEDGGYKCVVEFKDH